MPTKQIKSKCGPNRRIGDKRMMHTPGPWKIFDGYGSEFGKPIIVDSIPDVDGKCVANCICYMSTTNDDCLANARLIAAAPEMLDVLKLARVMLDAMIASSNGNIHDHCISTAGRIDEVIQKVTVTDAAQTSAREGS